MHFRKPTNLRRLSYSTRLNKNRFVASQLVSSQTKFSVSSRGLRLWRKLLDQQQKSLDHENCFKDQ